MPDKGLLAGTEEPAQNDHINPRRFSQGVDHKQRVCDHRQVAAVDQFAGNFHHRRSGSQKDGVAVLDQCCRQPPNLLLFDGLLLSAV